jgi:hypothetical protein
MTQQVGWERVDAELEEALASSFAVQPDPFRQEVIRAQIVAEARELYAPKTMEGALERTFSVQPNPAKYAQYRRMAMAAARQPLYEPARKSWPSRIFGFLAPRDDFELRLNDSIEAIVSGRATTSDCLERYPEDAERLAPLLGLASQLQAEYASLPVDQRLSGVRWRLQRATRETNTTPLLQPAGASFFRHLQWAAPLTAGVAASLVLALVVFQGLNSPSSGSNGELANGIALGDNIDYSRLPEIAGDNEVLRQAVDSIQQVRIAIENNQPPPNESLENLAAGSRALNAGLDDLESDDLSAAVYITEAAADTLEQAAPLVTEENLGTFEETQEQVSATVAASRAAVDGNASVEAPPDDGSEAQQDDDTAAGDTRNAGGDTAGDEADDESGEPSVVIAGDEAEEDAEEEESTLPDDLQTLLDSHADVVARFEDEELSEELLGDYIVSVDDLLGALEDPQNAANAGFTVELLTAANDDLRMFERLSEDAPRRLSAELEGAMAKAQELRDAVIFIYLASDQPLPEEATEEATAEETPADTAN